MILNIKRKNIPLILLNGRINKKSFHKWKKLVRLQNFYLINLICVTLQVKSQISFKVTEELKKINILVI